MNIYLLYKTDDMVNMTQADVQVARNTLEGALKSSPVYDLALIDSVLWRVGVVNTDKSNDVENIKHTRLDIPLNSQGFCGTALGSEGNIIITEFIHNIINNADRAKKRYSARRS